MKRVISLLVLVVFSFMVSSCGSTIRLKGSYPDSHFSKETDLQYEEVWTRVIDFFAMAGIPITTIDKSSGLIVASRVSFLNSYTREVNGAPLDPEAYVVIPTVRGMFGNRLEPNAAITGDWEMVGDWNVRIKANGSKTIVNVNMVNVECFYRTSGLSGNTTKIPIKSTGVFENSLLKYLTE